jgi:hypothetical protein
VSRPTPPAGLEPDRHFPEAGHTAGVVRRAESAGGTLESGGWWPSHTSGYLLNPVWYFADGGLAVLIAVALSLDLAQS